MAAKLENATQGQIINTSENCLLLNIASTNGLWQGNNPFLDSIPLLISQLAAILILSQSLYQILRPLHQPRIISDILGGILLGPTLLGKEAFISDLFPAKDIYIIETIAYLGLVFHIFIIGLEIEQTVIWRISKKALSFTVCGLIIPFAIGIAFFYLLQAFENHSAHIHSDIEGSLVWSAALTVTSFPIVNIILRDLKLLDSDIGRLAMPIAFVSDMGCCVLIAIFIPFCDNWANAPYIVSTTFAYVLGCLYTLRPIFKHLFHYSSKRNNNHFSEFYLCFILSGVLLSSFITDCLGTHPIVGSFVFGLIIPSELSVILIQRIDFFVSGLMMPIFFAICGIKVNIFKVEEWKLVVVIVIVLCAMKVISFMPISLVSDIVPRESFALGLLMNTKGVWAFLIVQAGLDKGVLLDRDYAVMIITLLSMTSLVAPIVSAIYQGANLPTEYKSRTIQDAKKEAELRFFTCIYSFHNVPGILNLFDLSYATHHNKITVFTLHLVELVGAASATLIVHDSHSHRFDDSHYPPGYSDTLETDQIVNAFREYQSRNRHISIQSLTSVSPFAAMPGDMCRLAEEKQVAFLILPFPKQATTREGLINESVAAFRNVNKSVLLDAPCSVGIYIEHGLVANTRSFGNHQVAMVFLGGHDDWEALAFAWRMSSNPKVSLTVIRLSEVDSADLSSRKSSSMEPVRSHHDRQREMDDDYIAEFRIRTAGKEHVEFKDKPLCNEEELVSTLKEIETKFELIILGRREGWESPLTTGLSSNTDCSELGVIGDWLAKSNSAMGSVLVVQQFIHPENRLDIEQLAMPQLPSPNSVVCGRTNPGAWQTSVRNSRKEGSNNDD